MSYSGDAAEQVVRISLESTEVVLKITGSAAKNIAAAIFAALRNRNKSKTKGHQRLTAMLKSGKELKVFTVKSEDLKLFAKEARRYGAVYCALRGKGKSADGIVDILVRAEDAAKINRIVERFKLATVDTASIKSEIEKSRAEKAAAQQPPEKDIPDFEQEKKLLDDMLGVPAKKEEPTVQNPTAGPEKSPPSGPTSEKPRKADEGAVKETGKPSVREELREIQAQRRQKESSAPGKEPEQRKKQPAASPRHMQPKRKKKKAKEKTR